MQASLLILIILTFFLALKQKSLSKKSRTHISVALNEEIKYNDAYDLS